MDYVFIIISVFGFALQFVLMQTYEKQIKQNLATGIFLTIITNIVGAVFFFAINLFKISVSKNAVFLAALLAVDMVAYNLLSLRALSLGNLAVYSMFMMLGGMALPVLYGVSKSINGRRSRYAACTFYEMRIAGENEKRLPRRVEQHDGLSYSRLLRLYRVYGKLQNVQAVVQVDNASIS